MNIHKIFWKQGPLLAGFCFINTIGNNGASSPGA